MYYVFDVDMTLALSNRPMSDEMRRLFKKAMAGKKYFFCSGAQLPKMLSQVGEEIASGAQALFPQMACEMWVDGKAVYQKKFQWAPGLKADIQNIIENSAYPERNGDHLQERGSMICVSTVGKSSNTEQRDRYSAWENVHQERLKFSKRLSDKYPQYDILVSGQTSVDIAMKGNNKSLVLPAIRKHFGDEEIHFFGDKIFEGGNDMPLAKALQAESAGNHIYPVNSPDDTADIFTQWLEKVA